jgi:hypothetical protein
MGIITPERYILGLRKTPVLLKSLFHGVSQEQAETLTDGPGGWNAVEALCHIRDYAPFVLERTRMILEHDNPTLPSFEPEDNSTLRDYGPAQVTTELAAFIASRKELVALLEGLSEAQWQRRGVLSKYGDGTLLDFTVHTVWHDLNHIEQIARTLQLSEALL